MYYKNNIGSTLTLVECLQRHGCKSLLFSSSATVYGEPQSVPIDESFPVEAINPYGRTKLFIEEILKDLCTSDPGWQVVLLRYFNPVGAHPSGRLGEDPKGYPNNLMPYVQQVAVGRRAELSIFGSDYATVDGTGVRDYIHVMDLAEGHMAALRKLLASSAGDGGGLGCVPYNLGTGTGTSVLQIVTAFGEACGKPIPYKLAPRRPGDAASCYASPALAEEALGWKARRSIAEGECAPGGRPGTARRAPPGRGWPRLTRAAPAPAVCRDQWHWASNNPYGYDPAPAEGGEGA